MCKQPYILKLLQTRLMSSFKTYEQGCMRSEQSRYTLLQKRLTYFGKLVFLQASLFSERICY